MSKSEQVEPKRCESLHCNCPDCSAEPKPDSGCMCGHVKTAHDGACTARGGTRDRDCDCVKFEVLKMRKAKCVLAEPKRKPNIKQKLQENFPQDHSPSDPEDYPDKPIDPRARQVARDWCEVDDNDEHTDSLALVVQTYADARVKEAVASAIDSGYNKGKEEGYQDGYKAARAIEADYYDPTLHKP